MSTPSTTTIESVQSWTDNRFIIDREAGMLAVLFLLVQVAAVKLTGLIASSGVQPERPVAQGSDAAAGAVWVGAEIMFAIALLGVIMLYKRAPEWVQKIVKMNLVIGLAIHLGASAANDGVFLPLLATVVIGLTFIMAIDHFDIYWILNNLFAIVVAIYVGVILAFFFGITGLVVAFVGLTIYDHVFANKQSWMFDMAEVLVKMRMPVIFIRPTSLQYDWDNLLDETDEEGDAEDDSTERSRNQWGIGTADLALPAGFAAAVAVAPTGAFLATGMIASAFVILGVLVACFRLRWEIINEGSGAGLPALSMGALGGWLLSQPVLLVIL